MFIHTVIRSKKYFLIYAGFLLIFIKCADNASTDPNEPQKNSPILGEWRYNSSTMDYKRIFKPDGTFTDTMVLKNSLNINDQTKAVVKGKYNFADSVLTFPEFQFESVVNFYGLSIGYEPYNYIVSVNNNTMTMKSFVVLEGSGNNDGFHGSWELNSWFAKYVKYYTVDNQYGSRKKVYVFSSIDNSVIDSTYYHNVQNDSTYFNYAVRTYHYYPPYLLMTDTVRIELKNNLMYWYYENQDRIYDKIK